MVGESIHWYIGGSRCNLDCSYCFRDLNASSDEEKIPTLARLLVDEGVRSVILGGGEPTLVKNLDRVLRILKGGGVYVALHTNGTTLSTERVRSLRGLVDDIALPMDSTNPDVQRKLRGETFMPTYRRLPSIAEEVTALGLKLGWHTVFTGLNSRNIPDLSKKLSKRDFDYWRIYEFNDDLSRQVFFQKVRRRATQKDIERFREIELLRGIGTPEKGYTDCLLAKLLLTEEKMSGDPRIKFVLRRDSYAEPYLFMDNSGEISTYAWFSREKRRRLGNIFRGGFEPAKQEVTRLNEDPFGYDVRAEEEWVETNIQDLPWWAVIKEGMSGFEEIEQTNPRYRNRAAELSDLWYKREERRVA